MSMTPDAMRNAVGMVVGLPSAVEPEPALPPGAEPQVEGTLAPA